MEKYRIPDHCIDDDGYREEEEPKKCEYPIFEDMQEMHYHRDASELTLIVEKFPIHGILVIVKHLLLRRDHRIECVILIEWDIIDTQ